MDSEKQEGQKTIVAFIAGLIIGGLLVWVFSAPSETTPLEITVGEDTAKSAVSGDTKKNDVIEKSEVTTVPVVVGEGSVTALDQAAGSIVVISNLELPAEEGWVVVRDYSNGVSGNILGAARYSSTQNLVPDNVRLLRNTEVGNTYQVLYFSENGDRVFDLSDDVAVTNGSGVVIASVITVQ